MLDPEFGNDGRVAVELGLYGDRANAVVVQPDGVFYQYMKVKDIPLLVEEHLLKAGCHVKSSVQNRLLKQYWMSI
jgi:hypothetical protein